MSDGPGVGEGVPEPQNTPEVFAREAAEEGVRLIAEEAADRGEVDDEGNVTMGEQTEEELAIVAGDAGVPQDKERRREMISTIKEIDERIASKPAGERLGGNDAADIAQQLSSLGFTQDTEDNKHTENYLKSKNLSSEDIAAINGLLPERDSNSDDHNMSEREASIRGGVAEQVRGVAERTAEQVTYDIDERTDIDGDQKRILKGKVNGLMTRITDIFDPDMPGGEWARKVGKTLYWSFIIAFIIIVAELNMINKAAGKK